MTTPNQGVLPALSSHSLHLASISVLIQMTTLLPSPCPALGWEMTDFEKVPEEESTVQGQQGCQPSPTYLCCQVVPRGQVLEPEEAVPVASSTPAGIVLHHLQGQEHTWNAAQSPSQQHLPHLVCREQQTQPGAEQRPSQLFSVARTAWE